MSRHDHRFYLPQPIIERSSVRLPNEQSGQITSVLRLRKGDRIRLFNGDGSEYEALIVGVESETVIVQVESCLPGDVPPRLGVQLALPVIKHDRFEWALQKVTELGAARIIPMSTEFSVISLPVDREERRQQRWHKIVVEAAEQCGRRDVPSIDPVTSFTAVIEPAGGAQVVLLWEDEETSLLTSLEIDLERPVRLVVGPEGGFSAGEIEAAKRAEALTASLGPFTLRSETAAVAGTAMLLARSIA